VGVEGGVAECWSDGVVEVFSWSWRSATREVSEDDGVLEGLSDEGVEVFSWSWRSATREVWEDDGVWECLSGGGVEVFSWSWRSATREVWEDDGVWECLSGGSVEVFSWSWRSATRRVSGRPGVTAKAPVVAVDSPALRVGFAVSVRVSFSTDGPCRLCPHAGQKPNDFLRCSWHRMHCFRVHA
jgi:hypothetical protein